MKLRPSKSARRQSLVRARIVNWLGGLAAAAMFAAVAGRAGTAGAVPLAAAGPGPAPVIDGRLRDPGWQSCAQLFPFVDAGGAGLAAAQTRARVFYDANALYIAFQCDEPTPKKLVADHEKRDSGLWRDDCVEVFLVPARPGKTVYHFIVNARGALYDSRNGNVHWNSRARAAARLESHGWNAELAIPWDDLGGRPTPGTMWRANFCRERKVRDELSAWSCTGGPFLNPPRFGRLLFGGRAVRLERLQLDPPAPGANSAVIALRLPPGPPAELFTDAKAPVRLPPDGRPVHFFYPLGLQPGNFVFEARRGSTVLWRGVFPAKLTPEPALPKLERALDAFDHIVAHIPGNAPIRTALAAAAAPARRAAGALRQAIESSLKRHAPLPVATYAALNTAAATAARHLGNALWPVWTQNPWLDLQRRQLPPGRPDISRVRILSLVNECHSANLIVSNLRNTPLRLRVVASGLTWQVPIPSNARNAVTNPGFEQDSNGDGIPDAWFHATGSRAGWRFVQTPDHGRVLAVDRARNPGVSTFRQRLSLEPGKRYVLQFQARTAGKDPQVRVVVIDQGWHRASGPAALEGGRDWHTVRTTITPRGKQPFQLVVWTLSGGSGKVWLDDFRLVPADGLSLTFPDSAPALRVADWQNLRAGGSRADPLLPLNPGGRLDIPPGENRQVWLTFPARNFPPGTYRGSLEFRPLAGRNDPIPLVKHVSFTLQYFPLHLPDHPRFRVYNWDYARTEGEVRDLFEHKVNVYLITTYMPLPPYHPDGTPAGAIDFSNLDQIIRLKLPYARRAHGEILFSYGIIRDFNSSVAGKYGWKFMSAPWVRAFKYAYSRWIRHLRKLGLQYGEFSVQIWDEATGGNVDKAVAGGKLLRSIDPRVRLVMDGAQSLAEVKRLEPYVDVWIPHLSHLLNGAEHEKLLAWYQQQRKHGKPVWTYTCRTSMKAQPPYEYHRLKPWYAARLDLDGVCYWAYNSWRGDPWNDFDGSIADCGVIYPGAGRPIDSRRWEASREGIQDWQLIRMVRALAAHSGKAAAQRRAEAQVETALRTVLADPSDPGRAETQRRALIRVAAALAAARPLRVATSAAGPKNGAAAVTCTTPAPSRGILWLQDRPGAPWHSRTVPPARRHVLELPGAPQNPQFRAVLLLWDQLGRTSTLRFPESTGR